MSKPKNSSDLAPSYDQALLEGAGSGQAPLHSYGQQPYTSNDTAQIVILPVSHIGGPLLPAPVNVTRRGPPAGRRFCLALFYAFLIYILVCLITGAITSAAINEGHRRHGHGKHGERDPWGEGKWFLLP